MAKKTLPKRVQTEEGVFEQSAGRGRTAQRKHRHGRLGPGAALEYSFTCNGLRTFVSARVFGHQALGHRGDAWELEPRSCLRFVVLPRASPA